LTPLKFGIIILDNFFFVGRFYTVSLSAPCNVRSFLFNKAILLAA